jgi:hypothetical protein
LSHPYNFSSSTSNKNAGMAINNIFPYSTTIYCFS